VWQEYKRSGGLALRNKLMEAYMPMVRYNAERIGAKLPQEVDNEDLISAGVFGLIGAIEAFDLKRGIKFETYCAPRIRGAILDELRSLDWVPRLVRSRCTKLLRIQEELKRVLGREPTESEIAEWLKITPEAYEKLRKAASAVTQVSLSRKHGETDSNREVCEIDVLEDKRGRDPLRELQRKDLRDLLTRGFSRAERLILVLYYYEEMTMKEIGQILDLSESRVSQMHSAILERLKEQFEERQKELTH
jgi:RNA polymerase sigma factor for flagellar operon FliA